MKEKTSGCNEGSSSEGEEGKTPPRFVIAMEPEELKMFFSGPSGNTERLQELNVCADAIDPTTGSKEWDARLKAANPEILLTSWSTPTIPHDLPQLRYVCHVGGSVRNNVPRALIERGVLVSNWGDSVSEGLAEAALMLALSALRRSHHFAIQMHQRRDWPTYPSRTKTLFGKRVGIHGFGAAARNLVRLLAPFRVRIWAYSKNVPSQDFRDAGVEQCSALEDLFAESDILFEMEGLTPTTVGIVTDKLLRRLRQDAVFVNVARGALIDEAAAVRLAAAGRIRLALDVYAQEPLSPDSPLRGLPDVTLFPHVGSPTDDQLYRAGDMALMNLQKFLRGEMPSSIVTLEIYDRST